MISLKKRIVNRDLSWLRFNSRVLQEAADPRVPLIERWRFLGIFSNNLDEFFRVRYASIQRTVVLGDKARNELGGYLPQELLHEISDEVQRQQEWGQAIHDELVRLLEVEDIVIPNETELTKGQQEFVRQFFIEKVSPTVFTLLIDGLQRLPELKDRSIYLAIKMTGRANNKQPKYALIEVPTDLIGRFIELPKYGKRYIMYLEDLIRYNLRYIFFIFDYEDISAHTIKITRDAELDIDNDLSRSFIDKVSRSLRNRRTGDPVRLVFDQDIPKDLLDYIVHRVDLDPNDSLLPGGRYHNKRDYIKFPNAGGPELEYPKLEPLYHPDLDLEQSHFRVIRKKDVLLCTPYHTFSHYIRFLREAALDPDVVSIRITLYRLADKSRVISALINAAKNGKQVTVVIELQARFDEEANIRWTQELRQEGVRVIFGVNGLKVHSKVCLISRKEGGKFRDYAALGTGNLNESTSRIYTDYHLFTSDKRITKDLHRLFEFFEANYRVQNYDHLIVSPHFTRSEIGKLIDAEIDNAKNGLPARIWMKMNSLSDEELIDKLYEANAYGVEIKLVVRGICSLIPGVQGLSEHIEAISIVDRFLEHTRLFIFENGGHPRYFIGSADLMKRNLDYRVEVTVPIHDKKIQKDLKEQFRIIWNDNVKARVHTRENDNPYRGIDGPEHRSQMVLYSYFGGKTDL
ncbi:polyphosphate kinase 1 [bacterium]|nr:polyphosphate kinase 1 [bacterium]